MTEHILVLIFITHTITCLSVLALSFGLDTCTQYIHTYIIPTLVYRHTSSQWLDWWSQRNSKPGDLVGVNKDSYLILDTFAIRVRQQGDGYGGGHQAHRPVQRHWRVGQADPGAGGGRSAAHDTQGQVP